MSAHRSPNNVVDREKVLGLVTLLSSECRVLNRKEITCPTDGDSVLRTQYSEMIARRFIVRGRVQGVGYRYFAVRAARAAEVTGTVRNLPDGTVEAIAEGSVSAIAQFKAELERGPSFSVVSSVDEIETVVTNRFRSFEVDY